MRAFLTAILAFVIASCPVLCGADEIGHSAHHERAADTSNDHGSQDSCPDSADNCVCRGAVQRTDGKPVVPDLAYAVHLFHFAPPVHLPLSLCSLTSQGSPNDLASWGDSLTIRALLQNFRC